MSNLTPKQVAKITEKAFSRRIRMRQVVPVALEHALELLQAWQDAMPHPAPENDWKDTTFSASVSLDWQRLRWYGDHTGSVMFPAMVSFMEQSEFPLQLIEELRAMYSVHSPLSMGSWIEALPAGVNIGWYFTGRFSPERLPKPFHATLMALDVPEIVQFGMSLGGDERFAEILCRLPGETIGQKLAAAAERFPVLGAEPMSPRLEAILQSGEDAQDVFFSAWLLPDDALKAGVQLWLPDTTTMLMAADVHYNRFDRRQLAEFQGTIGAVDEPETFEYVYLDAGANLEVCYKAP